MQDTVFVLSVPVDTALDDAVSRGDAANLQPPQAPGHAMCAPEHQLQKPDRSEQAVYTLRGAEVVCKGQEDITYLVTICNNCDEPLALRAHMCCAGEQHFVAQRTSLLQTAEDAGAFVALEEKSSAVLQGILWSRGDQFVWELVGDVHDAASGSWQTRLVIEASYLADADNDTWVEVELPVLDITTSVQD